MHREATPIPPREINPFIPETLEKVILKVLSKEPSARYRTADQLGRVLQIVQRELHETAGDAQKAPRSAPVRQKTSRDRAAQPRPDSGPIPNSTRSARRTTGSLQPAEPRLSDQWSSYTDTEVYPSEPAADIDWLAVFLGLVAVAAWGGLIPFFIWVYNNLF